MLINLAHHFWENMGYGFFMKISDSLQILLDFQYNLSKMKWGTFGKIWDMGWFKTNTGFFLKNQNFRGNGK